MQRLSHALIPLKLSYQIRSLRIEKSDHSKTVPKTIKTVTYCFRTLHYLMLHLHRVASHSPKTGMTAKNLAIVWAPNLIREEEEKEDEKDGILA